MGKSCESIGTLPFIRRRVASNQGVVHLATNARPRVFFSSGSFIPPRLRISRLTAMLKSIDPVAVMNQAASCFLLAFRVPYVVQPL